jgi:hypothetical protein
MPATFTRPGLVKVGFVGWRRWDELRASNFGEVPQAPASYVVYRESVAAPVFLPASPAGWFKDKNPSVTVTRLEAEWVEGEHVVYIGKADVARRRLGQYARFGAGDPVGHWGGRLIWQLADSADLLVAWRVLAGVGTARADEKRLLARFGEVDDGRRPFANLTG